MSIPPERYIQYSPKDFFYVMVHDPTPPPVEGADGWAPDGGSQPPPHWMPGVWTTHADTAGSVEIVDIEPGRASWRVRAGARDAPMAAPLRELGGDDASRALFALGMGVSHDKRPRGLATDGKLAVTVHGGQGSALLVAGPDRELAILPPDDAALLGAHDDLAELPAVVWDGRVVSPAGEDGAVEGRAALGVTPSGRVLVARGAVASVAPLAQALARAGCTRAVVLDRGVHATGLLDRAGTASPPRARYDETVLYAIATPLRPRGFRFDPSTLVAKK
jgi:hypothetical protein